LQGSPVPATRTGALTLRNRLAFEQDSAWAVGQADDLPALRIKRTVRDGNVFRIYPTHGRREKFVDLPRVLDVLHDRGGIKKVLLVWRQLRRGRHGPEVVPEVVSVTIREPVLIARVPVLTVRI